MADRPVSIAQHYHKRTKYHPATLKDIDLDWSKQPSPFKEYKIGAAFDLKPYLTDKPDKSVHVDEAAGSRLAEDQSWRRLSRLLFHSYGLTVKMATRMSGEMIYLRASPSAGALYPAEIYLISRGTPLLAAGLYSYQAQSHSLLRFWDSEVWSTLQDACFWHPTLDQTQLAIVVTTLFHRSVWKYQDRAYRRMFLDTGHLLGNIELASAINDYRPHLIGGFMDETVNRMLYLDPEQEGAIAVLALADRLNIRENLPLAPTCLPSVRQMTYPKLPDGELLPYFHKATQIPATQDAPSLKKLIEKQTLQVATTSQADQYNFPFCLKVSMNHAVPAPWGENLAELASTILKRRSTRALSGASLSLDELKTLLDFTYQPQNYVEQGLDPAPDYFDLSLIETFIAVSGVDGLEEGCYYYAPKAQELRQIRFKNFRQELHRLCLGQNLGRDAGVVLFHTADLNRATLQYGDRVYRYLHMDAGHLGQRLNLAAIRLGLGVSGIAGFFDDEVNEVLGIPIDEAVLYITTLGRPRR
ncbi:MAG: SagB/ThcOx family dehydrogenase [Drouetiella hepatica Uher 2000/2452]|jgi:SagB-type dehydrogenase family enzyme|uniref:SagB/ThcOx family dehydrogenase n=1 Tax=Drouetiella hepatica Uher 2000/2452 TaxID=904376 RepID=A0A951UKN6_9CYAN|nr:SagB/ThcOx family dehydrogenase [Drouetiella hepatica Uher 2000/2452]